MNTQRDATVQLRETSDWRGWLMQLKSRAAAHNIWNHIDPTTATPLRIEPISPELPDVSEYQPVANVTNPQTLSELSAAGQRAYKEDTELYKLKFEKYKSDRHNYEKEQSSLQHIIAFIQSTVNPHLQRTCCQPEEPVMEWISNLKAKVGIEERLEREQARNRYYKSLEPMRNAAHWETWLADYDQAATEAESLRVLELTDIDVITKDFIEGVNKVASPWTTAFQDRGRFDPDLTRKDMMRRFREYMTLNHPSKAVKRNRAAFVSDESSYLVGSGKPHADAQRSEIAPGEAGKTHADARRSEIAPGVEATNKKRGRNRRQIDEGGRQPKRAATPRNPVESGRGRCVACGMPHNSSDCFYLEPANAPEWWRPNPQIEELVRYKRDHDKDLQRALRQSGSRSRTPYIKTSQSNTPELTDEQ